MMLVSVIIPTYNKSSYLNLTLSGFLKQSYESFEIIIVNDGSTDLTKNIVDKYSDKLNIKYVYQKNKGRAAARNKGIINASGNIIVFNDDDRIPDISFLQEHVNVLLSGENMVSIGNKKEVLAFIDRDDQYNLWEIIKLVKLNPMLITSNIYSERINLFNENDIINNFKEIKEKYLLDEAIDNYMAIRNTFNSDLKGFHFGWALSTTANLAVKKVDMSNVFFDETYKKWGRAGG